MHRRILAESEDRWKKEKEKLSTLKLKEKAKEKTKEKEKEKMKEKMKEKEKEKINN